MSPTPDSPPPAIEGLQFEKAEIPGRTCAVCKVELPGEFFQLNGTNICAACAETFGRQQGRPTTGGVLRGVLFGFGAALVCAAGYGLFTYLTGWEVGIIAIAVGWLVGRAVRIGAYDLGGRRCQAAALLLTYFAITMGYVPLVFVSLQRAQQEENAKFMNEMKGKLQQGGVAPVEMSMKGSIQHPLVMVILSIVTAVILPFLALTEGFSGILGIVIIGFGLHQAWKVTARVEHTIEGPFGAEPTPENTSA